MLTGLLKNIRDKFKKQETSDLYYGFYLFGHYNEKPIWNWANWKECLPLLQPIIELSPEIPSIKSSQAIPMTSDKNSEFISYDKGSLHFGRMTFNESSNEKWTTKYINEPNWTFFDTEIVFPTFSYCEKNKVNPEIFIKVTNENLSGTIQSKINQSIIILFKKDLVDSNKLKNIEHNIEILSDKLNVVLSGKIIRPHHYPSDYGTYTDYIRLGSHGVIEYDNLEFSKRFTQYGMQTIRQGIH